MAWISGTERCVRNGCGVNMTGLTYGLKSTFFYYIHGLQTHCILRRWNTMPRIFARYDRTRKKRAVAFRRGILGNIGWGHDCFAVRFNKIVIACERNYVCRRFYEISRY